MWNLFVAVSQSPSWHLQISFVLPTSETQRLLIYWRKTGNLHIWMFDTRLNSDELLWFLGSWHCECRLSITRLRLTVAYFETVQLITAVCPTQVHTVFTQADKKNILKRYESKTYPSVGYFHRPLLCKAQHRLLSFTPRMSSTDIVGWLSVLSAASFTLFCVATSEVCGNVGKALCKDAKKRNHH